MKIIVSRRARRQIEKIQAWWVENRPDAPALFLDELSSARQLFRVSPELGSIYAEQKAGLVRRVLLARTGHHLYYRYRPERRELTVLIVRGPIRQRGPKL